MKKVIRIIDRLNVGGPTIHVSILSAKLNTQQYSTTLISGTVCEEEGDMSYVVNQHHVKPIFIPELSRAIHLQQDIVALWKIFRIMRKERPDIVHTHKSKAGFIGRIAAILAGVPVIIHTFHGHVFHGYFSKFKTKLFITIEKILSLFTTKIVVISEQQFQEICYKYRVAFPRKCTVIPLGFLFKDLHLLDTKKGWLKKKYNWQQNDIVIGIVGRLATIKNHEMFLHVAKKINQIKPNVRFAIIGDGEQKQSLLKLHDQLSLGNNVIFTGWLQQPEEIYCDIDIMALTSINEGTPVVLIEGMYYQKPVVSTNVGGVVDIVDSESGFLCRPNDVDSFCKYLLQLIEDENLREKMGKHAHEKMKNAYSYERLVSDIENLYANFTHIPRNFSIR